MSRFIREKGRFIRGKYTAEEGIIEPAKKLWKRLPNTIPKLPSDSRTAFLVSQRHKLLKACSGSFFRKRTYRSQASTCYPLKCGSCQTLESQRQSRNSFNLKSLGLHSCDHSEFPSGSLINTFMIHDLFVLLSWHTQKPGIIQFPIPQISKQRQCAVLEQRRRVDAVTDKPAVRFPATHCDGNHKDTHGDPMALGVPLRVGEVSSRCTAQECPKGKGELSPGAQHISTTVL